MASHRNQHRPSRRGHGAGHGAFQEYPVSYSQEPVDRSYDPGLFMGHQGLTEELCVDPRLILRQEYSGGTGYSHDHGDSGPFQPAYDASVYYPQGSGTTFNYINTPDPDVSSDGFGEST